MRVVVTGSRFWKNREVIYDTLDELHRKYVIEVLYHGEASGADTMAKQWAMERGIPVFGCPYAGAYGKQGGSIRNGWLLDEGRPDLVVAFPTAESKGTWNMLTQAKGRGIGIRLVAGRWSPKRNTTVTMTVNA